MSANVFQIANSCTVFVQLSLNLAHMIYLPIHKYILEHIFKILDFELFGKLFKFQIWTLSLEQQQWTYLGQQASL